MQGKDVQDVRRLPPPPRLLRRHPLRPGASHGEPDGAPRAQGARPAAGDLGGRDRAARAGRALQREDGSDARARQGQARGRAARGPRQRAADRAHARAASRGVARTEPSAPPLRIRLTEERRSMRRTVTALVISALALVAVLAANAAAAKTVTFEVALKGKSEAPAAPATNKGKVELRL